MSEWKAIDTAPTDGTHILAYEDGCYAVVSYMGDAWYGAYGCYDPSRWMPLPSMDKTPLEDNSRLR